MNIQVDGVQAHVERLGSGPQVLLLHGWGPESVSLNKHLSPIGHLLKPRFEVTMLEFPGHGQSGSPGGDWGVKEYAEWARSAMKQLAMNRPAIVAHSFGARVAVYLAANYPTEIGPLVLTGAAGLRPRKTLRGRVRTRLFQAGRLGLNALALVPAFKKKGGQWLSSLRAAFSSGDYLATPESLRGSFSRIVRQDLKPLLSQITQPTLLVWGEKDSATPLWMGESMQKEIKGARLLVYQADDHFAYLNQPARFATAVTAFLEEVGEA